MKNKGLGVTASLQYTPEQFIVIKVITYHILNTNTTLGHLSYFFTLLLAGGGACLHCFLSDSKCNGTLKFVEAFEDLLRIML